MTRRVNPMYTFTDFEIEALCSIYQRHSGVSNDRLVFREIDFRDKNTNKIKNPILQLLQDKNAYADTEKIIYNAYFPTTLTIPHHIDEGGNKIDQPEREGPIRTYFDGSYISSLGHAIAIEIDNKNQKITTQCPHGYDFPIQSEFSLTRPYPNYDRVTLRHKQQQDSHSCTALTLHNMFAMAGFHEVQSSIDIQSWRSELLSTLEFFGIKGYHNILYGEEISKVVENIKEKKCGHPNPIFDRRFL